MSDGNELFGFTGGFMGAIGAIRCLRCGEAWLRECAPAICTQCGARLTDRPGEGFEPLLNLMELFGRADQIVRCPFCGFRFPGRWPLPQCPRCKRPLDLAQPRDTLFSRLRRRIASFF